MNTNEFQQEMGALLRRLQDRVNREPELHYGAFAKVETKAHIERAIITLVALRLELESGPSRD